MAAIDDTVADRVRIVRTTLLPSQFVAVAAFVTAIVFTLVVIQEPLVHDSLHDFRHATGIVCH